MNSPHINHSLLNYNRYLNLEHIYLPMFQNWQTVHCVQSYLCLDSHEVDNSWLFMLPFWIHSAFQKSILSFASSPKYLSGIDTEEIFVTFGLLSCTQSPYGKRVKSTRKIWFLASKYFPIQATTRKTKKHFRQNCLFWKFINSPLLWRKHLLLYKQTLAPFPTKAHHKSPELPINELEQIMEDKTNVKYMYLARIQKTKL